VGLLVQQLLRISRSDRKTLNQMGPSVTTQVTPGMGARPGFHFSSRIVHQTERNIQTLTHNHPKIENGDGVKIKEFFFYFDTTQMNLLYLQ
jgi:hypothetical protein